MDKGLGMIVSQERRDLNGVVVADFAWVECPCGCAETEASDE